MKEVVHATSRAARSAIVSCFALVFFTGATLSAPAQTTTLRPGAWIRFAMGDGGQRFVGRVVSVSSDSITLQYGESWMSERQVAQYAATTLPIRQVSGMEVQTAKHTHAAEGVAVGLITGAFVGAKLGANAQTPCDGPGCSLAPSVGAALVAVPLGALGALLGAAIGGSIGTEVWTSADTKTATHLELMPRKNGVAARLSISIH